MDETAQIAHFVRLTVTDDQLPRPIRAACVAIATDLSSPELVMQRLRQVAVDFLPGVPRRAPEQDLARAVSISTFFDWHLRPEVKALMSPQLYLARLEASPDPTGLLLSDLRDDIELVPWQHAWLGRATDISGLSGRQIKQRFQLKSDPPYIIMLFTEAACSETGLQIRATMSLDAVLGEHEQWRPGGLPDGSPEFVDGTILRAALTALELRP